MAVAFLLAGLSGYMLDCISRVSARTGRLALVAYRSAQRDTAFQFSFPEGVIGVPVDEDQAASLQSLSQAFREYRPTAMFVSGWDNPVYRRLVARATGDVGVKVLMFDNNNRGDFKQRAGRLFYWKYLSKFDIAFVPGERSYQLARQLGFAEGAIVRGLYSISLSKYDSRRRLADLHPRSFLFAGRYAPEKGLEYLLAGYQFYRATMADPWPLLCAGSGGLSHLLTRAEGVQDLGFLQPVELARHLTGAGVFVLPSIFEPWGVVISEACAAGLPILCTERCGAGVELVHDRYNGRRIPAHSADAVAEAMMWAHENHALLPTIGARSRALVGAYDENIWVEKVAGMLP